MQLLQTWLDILEKGDDGCKILDTLFNNLDQWLPNSLIQHGIYSEWTSNRVEVLVDNFKIKFGFTRRSASKLCKNLKYIFFWSWGMVEIYM